MVFLRKATMNDMDLIYEWANDPLVRANSFKTENILYEDHVKWFNSIMLDDTVVQFVLMEDDMPVGQIRLNIKGSEAEIGYSISDDCRGQGYGNKILDLVSQEVKEKYPYIRKLVAKVKPDNMASRVLFEKKGYKLKYAYYAYDISGD